MVGGVNRGHIMAKSRADSDLSSHTFCANNKATNTKGRQLPAYMRCQSVHNTIESKKELHTGMNSDTSGSHETI
jgi:hypothetical protein